jgi:hypothetical protein
MKRLAATITALFLATSVSVQAEEKFMPKANALSMTGLHDLRLVTPGLEKYQQGPVSDL